jgi:uncharacterized BrkB/YihY/UPF0761 family membrane protein
MDRLRRLKSRAARCRRNERLAALGRIFAALLVIVAGIDIISTSAALAAGAIEANPVALAMQKHLGASWAVPKVLIHLLFALFIVWLPSTRMLRCAGLVVAAYVLVAVNNLHIAGLLF